MQNCGRKDGNGIDNEIRRALGATAFRVGVHRSEDDEGALTMGSVCGMEVRRRTK